jgi:hypothetical protein
MNQIQFSSKTDAQTRETAFPSVLSKTDLEFAHMLAVTLKQKVQEQALATLSPVPSSAKQLAFLNQPAQFNLPLFLARRWTKGDANRTDLPNSGNVNTSEKYSENSNALRSYSAKTLKVQPSHVTLVTPKQSKPSPVADVSVVEAAGRKTSVSHPMPLSAFPRPKGDNGRGIHWIPTTQQSHDVIDKFVQEAVDMGIKWVTFLNDGTNITANDYLVRQLTARGIEPIMRVYTDGGAPIEGDLAGLVRHYKPMGVNYYQLYNEPNLRIENQGRAPDPKAYVEKWLPAAKAVIEAGGLPGFGSLSPTPGIAPGAAIGDMDDLRFLRESLREIKRRGEVGVLDRSWLSVHNYGREYLRFREYDQIIRSELGRSMPVIGTEAGIYPGDTLSQDDAINVVADAYRYLPQREDYYFAYTYWILANESGNGHSDSAWDHQALFNGNNHSRLVDILKQEA